MRRIPRERKRRRSRGRALHTIRQSGFIPPFLPLSFLLSRKEEASDHQKTTFPFFANLNAPFCRSRTFSEEPFNAAGIRHKGGVGLLTGPKENRSRQDSNCSAEEEAKNGIKEVVRSFTFPFPFSHPSPTFLNYQRCSHVRILFYRKSPRLPVHGMQSLCM